MYFYKSPLKIEYKNDAIKLNFKKNINKLDTYKKVKLITSVYEGQILHRCFSILKN